MDSDPFIFLLKIAAVVLLVLLNGFFVAAEFALVKIRDTQLSPLVAKAIAEGAWPSGFWRTWIGR
jgi:CBS domain containing-hemolysin-like protein